MKMKASLTIVSDSQSFSRTANNDPLMPHAARFVPDTQAFSGARLSCQKVMRFFGIELDWPIAGRLEFKWLERLSSNGTLDEIAAR